VNATLRIMLNGGKDMYHIEDVSIYIGSQYKGLITRNPNGGFDVNSKGPVLPNMMQAVRSFLNTLGINNMTAFNEEVRKEHHKEYRFGDCPKIIRCYVHTEEPERYIGSQSWAERQGDNF